MNIDTLTLQIFISVAKTGSFTKAAAQVGRTQSAISQQIAKLEYLLGKPLLVRGKILSLTAEGELFLSYASKIFALQHEVIHRFKEPEIKGEVYFGLPDDFASVYLSDVLAEFIRIHPSVFLNITCDFTLNLFTQFKLKKFDLVLVKMNRPDDFPNGVDIWSEPLFWVGDSSLVEKLPVPLPLVLSPQPCVYRNNAIATLEKANLAWRLVFSSPSYAGIIAAVKAGMGITALPRTMIPENLHIFPQAKLPQLSEIHVSLLKHHAESEAINSFESFVLRKIRH